LNEGKVVGRELVVAHCHSPTRLDLGCDTDDSVVSIAAARDYSSRLSSLPAFRKLTGGNQSDWRRLMR
jgi:hypothetical protein